MRFRERTIVRHRTTAMQCSGPHPAAPARSPRIHFTNVYSTEKQALRGADDRVQYAVESWGTVAQPGGAPLRRRFARPIPGWDQVVRPRSIRDHTEYERYGSECCRGSPGVTFTAMVQELRAASDPIARLMVLLPDVAVTVPPHMPVRPFVVDTIRPPGSMSLKLIPVAQTSLNS
jgi:hypothetical protein